MPVRGLRSRGAPATSAATGGITVVIWLLGAAVFFREQWTSGFATLMGNEGDTRFATYVCEHWFQVFHGHASWLDPGYVFPVKGLLGWSDTYVLYEVLYAPLRLIGAGPFLALQVTDILLSLVGFVSFVALVRTAFAAPYPLAWAAGLAFTFSNALWLHSGAYQHSGIYVTPLVALLSLRSWQAAVGGRRSRSLALGAAAGLLAALLLYSTYYVSYFSFLVAAVFVVVLVLMQPRRAWAWASGAVTTVWPAVAAGVVAFAAGLVPFALTYLPARKDNPGTSYADVMLYAPRLRHLFDFGRGNVVWSSAVQHAFPQIDFGASELNWATTPVLMLSAVAGGLLCAWWARTGRAAFPAGARAATALAATAAIAALLPLHTRVATPWALVHHLPGAGAMRAIDRIELVAGLAAILAVTASATEAWGRTASSAAASSPTASSVTGAGPLRRTGRHGGRTLLPVAVIAAVVVLILVEQVNTTPSSALGREQQDRLIASAPRPPAACRAFYVVDSRQRLLWFQAQIDAMLIAQRLRLPTVNGYPSVNPRGWALSDITSPGYADAVRNWVRQRGVQDGMCRLDLGTMSWDSTPAL